MDQGIIILLDIIDFINEIVKQTEQYLEKNIILSNNIHAFCFQMISLFFRFDRKFPAADGKFPRSDGKFPGSDGKFPGPKKPCPNMSDAFKRTWKYSKHVPKTPKGQSKYDHNSGSRRPFETLTSAFYSIFQN